MRNQTINYQSETNPGVTDRISVELPEDGRLTRLYVEAVAGEAADVRRRWFIETPNGRDTNVLVNALPDKDYLAGDDSTFDLRVDERFTADDELVLEVENTDPQFAYPNIAFAQVVYGNGDEMQIPLVERLIGGVL